MRFYATLDADSMRPYIPAVPVMLPASSWARYGLKAPRLPAHVVERAADCGGFVATLKNGGYTYTPDQYADWLLTWAPEWAATFDYCCEPEIVIGADGIRARQEQTTEMAWRFWQDYRAAPWAWVPTVQGWEVADYSRHARQLAPLVAEMGDHYGTHGAFRVGIGTLCRRASPLLIRQVVNAVAAELPGVPLHLWGVKLTLLQHPVALPAAVASIDSAAWNGLFGSDREEWRASGLSQRRWSYTVALPRYLAKIERAMAAPKQLTLLEAA